ncbi:radical SAM protein [Nanoarchaeota archaeon]
MNCTSCLFNFQNAKYRFVLISVTNECNNACDYCYLSCNKKVNSKFISIDTVKQILKKYANYLKNLSQEECFLTIVWHGGEPLLAGRKFFKDVLKIQKDISNKYKIKFNNGIETNGTLITEKWADFLRDNGFVIGISLDGPNFVHDIHRRGRDNISSFSNTVRGINILESKNIPFSVLSVISNKNFQHYKEILKFFIKFKNLRYVDFLPCYDPNGKIEYLSPENYGAFLVSTFEEWIKLGGSNILKIRFFEDLMLKISKKVKKNTLIGCEIMGRCGEIQYITEEGDLYPCVTLPQKQELKLGNLCNSDFDQVINSKSYKNFQDKFNLIHDECKSCNIFSICKAGCATRRFYHPNKESNGKDYYCLARKMIINKVKQYLNKNLEVEKWKKA